MATTVWKGHISFGLVSIPVRIFRAARSERVNLRELYRVPAAVPAALEARKSQPVETANREEPPAVLPVRRVAMEQVEEQPVPRENLTKGYEFEKDRFVTIDPAELRDLQPKTATEMEISEFVEWREIDPVYLETSYYVRPEEAGEQAYALLYEAMRQSGLVALAKLAMHRREHIVVLRPGKSGILAHTMFFENEVRSREEYKADASLANPKSLELAGMLIRSLHGPFEPAKFRDSYREKLQALIDAKIEGRETAAAPRPAKRVADITEALRKSLAIVKKPVKPAGRAPSRMRSRRGS